MSGQLEKQLGELNGILKGLPPALERLEDRQNEEERRGAAIEERVENLRREYDIAQERLNSRIKELYGKCEEALKSHNTNYNSIGYLEKDVKLLQEKDRGWTDKLWDLVKIIVAAGLAAFLTWKISKGA